MQILHEVANNNNYNNNNNNNKKKKTYSHISTCYPMIHKSNNKVPPCQLPTMDPTGHSLHSDPTSASDALTHPNLSSIQCWDYGAWYPVDGSEIRRSPVEGKVVYPIIYRVPRWVQDFFNQLYGWWFKKKRLVNASLKRRLYMNIDFQQTLWGLFDTSMLQPCKYQHHHPPTKRSSKMQVLAAA